MLRNILMVGIFFLVSCTSTTHKEYQKFKDDIWHVDSVLVFEYNIKDTIKTYSLDLNIRYTVNYKFQNLFLFLSGSWVDTLDIQLKEKDGTPIGKGLTDIREITVRIADKKRYEKSGKHFLSIEQAMRYGKKEEILQLKHIKDIGLIISQNE